MLIALLIPLGLASLLFTVVLFRAAVAKRTRPTAEGLLLGAVTNFFDTLGIGSFAPTMAWFKFRKLVPDRLIPPTMLVGHSLPSIMQAFIFLILLGLLVDFVLIVGCAFALMFGGLVGAPMVANAKVWVIQLAVAIALLIAATLYAVSNLQMFPAGGTATALSAELTAIAIAASFVFGLEVVLRIAGKPPIAADGERLILRPQESGPAVAGGARADERG